MRGVGDGSCYALILFNTEKEQHRTRRAVQEMVRRAVALDGTCTLTLLYI
jgi:D-lactate dehydrogenase (cytochrome)